MLTLAQLPSELVAAPVAFERRLALCEAIGHCPVAQRVLRHHTSWLIYFCSLCGVGLVQTREGCWRARSNGTGPLPAEKHPQVAA